VATLLDEGIVFLADSRTNAGIDNISTFRKMTVFERKGDRVLVLMSAVNLAIRNQSLACSGQTVRQAMTAPSSWTPRIFTRRPNAWAVLFGPCTRERHRVTGARNPT
jgi:putative proteasome-type protease